MKISFLLIPLLCKRFIRCRRTLFSLFSLKEQEFKKIASDSAVPGLNRNQAMDNIVTIPDIRIVKNFNSIIQPVFLKKEANVNQIQSLTQNHDTLLPKLMSGQLEIKN